jgi:rRNA maturation RNase YbeY
VSGSLLIQRRRGETGVDVAQMRRAIRLLLQDLLEADRFDLAIYIVRSPEMARLNQKFLQHEGSTDVITFDYAERPQKPQRRAGVSAAQRAREREQAVSSAGLGTRDVCPALHGEIFVCLDEAVSQARRFRTTWTSELVRYVIHGILHLLGHDDSRPVVRRKMKREENRLLREITRRFPLRKIGRSPKLAA